MSNQTDRIPRQLLASPVYIPCFRRRSLSWASIPVGDAALQRAGQEWLADAEIRVRRQERGDERRAEMDHEYVRRFAAGVQELFPNWPAGHEQIIAEHACQEYRGGVGRSAGAKNLDEEFIRHTETNYDEFLVQGMERREARGEVQDEIDKA